METGITAVAKKIILMVYALSPYFWLDSYLKKREQPFEPQSSSWQEVRDQRLFLSEFYIVFWLVLSFGLMLLTLFYSLPFWVAVLSLLRVVGVLNKELGVILFGVCKITEGRMVAATGRVIVLAMVNFLTAMFLFAIVYQSAGHFIEVPKVLQEPYPIAGIVQALDIQFSMSRTFEPDDALTWAVSVGQSAFMFVFGTMILSMFVSLLTIKPIKS